jgi:glutaredoxin
MKVIILASLFFALFTIATAQPAQYYQYYGYQPVQYATPTPTPVTKASKSKSKGKKQKMQEAESPVYYQVVATPAPTPIAQKYVIIGASWCSNCHDRKWRLKDNGIEFDYIDYQTEPSKVPAELWQYVRNGVPVVVNPDRTIDSGEKIIRKYKIIYDHRNDKD